MLAEDQWKQIRPIRWKKGQRPEFRLSVTGVTREDERQLRKTAKGMGLSFSLFFAVLARAFRDHRVIILPDGAKFDELIDNRLVERIDELVEKRIRKMLADANISDPYMK